MEELLAQLRKYDVSSFIESRDIVDKDVLVPGFYVGLQIFVNGSFEQLGVGMGKTIRSAFEDAIMNSMDNYASSIWLRMQERKE